MKKTKTNPIRPNTTCTDPLAVKFLRATAGLSRATGAKTPDPQKAPAIDPAGSDDNQTNDKLLAKLEAMFELLEAIHKIVKSLEPAEPAKPAKKPTPAPTPAPTPELTPAEASRAWKLAIAGIMRKNPGMNQDTATVEAARQYPFLHAATIKNRRK